MCSKILVSALWWTKYIMRLFPNYLKRIICVSAPLFVFVLYSSRALYCFFLSLSSKFLSSASASFFPLSLSLPLRDRNSSCSFTQSLPRFVLPLIRFCLPTPPRHSHTHSLTPSLFFLFPSIPFVGLHWRNAIRFPISGPHCGSRHTHTHTQFQPPKNVFSPQNAPYRIFDLHGGVMTVYLSPWRE